MEIKGVCWIANKWESTEKDFTKHQNQYGKLRATGKVAWCDKSKDKDGNEKKVYVSKLFVCFDPESVDILEACQRDMMEIWGILKTETYQKDGENKRIEKIYINKVSRFDKLKTLNQKIKEDSVAQEVINEDEMPF
jgi:hypothetical protein